MSLKYFIKQAKFDRAIHLTKKTIGNIPAVGFGAPIGAALITGIGHFENKKLDKIMKESPEEKKKKLVFTYGARFPNQKLNQIWKIDTNAVDANKKLDKNLEALKLKPSTAIPLGALMGAGYAGIISGGKPFKSFRAASYDRIKSNRRFRDSFKEQFRRGGFGGGFKQQTTNPKPYFSTLGLSGKEKTKKEVEKMFKVKAMQNHPDRGGSEETMKKINEARDALKNSEWFQKLGFFKKLRG
jgi:hypothetical protein